MTIKRTKKSPAEWRSLIGDEAYRVARQGGTERPFTGRYNDHSEVGTYTCVCCGLPLFESDTKFNAGCGWPSFFKPLAGAHITNHEDLSHGMVRVEVRCAGCDAHLGHVFRDGPPPTGLRYCINSVCLNFDGELNA